MVTSRSPQKTKISGVRQTEQNKDVYIVAFFGALIGIMYGFWTMQYELMTGCFRENPGSFCSLGSAFMNIPAGLLLRIILLGNYVPGIWSYICLLLADGFLFGLTAYFFVARSHDRRAFKMAITMTILIAVHLLPTFLAYITFH